MGFIGGLVIGLIAGIVIGIIGLVLYTGSRAV